MRVVLFYTGNKRTNAFETVLREYVRSGHETHLLTTCEPGELHAHVSQFGVITSGFPVPRQPSALYYARQIAHLAGYCRRHGIEVVLSQLQHANIISVFAQGLTSARFYMFRHHERGKNTAERVADRLINAMAPRIVVLSETQKKIVISEGVREVLLVPLLYDFSAYAVSEERARAIREAHPCDLLLVMISRFVPGKRHALAFEAVERLVRQGRSVKMLAMDDGPDRASLETWVRDRALTEHIFFCGFQTNVMDYLEAADVLVHTSSSEVSCSVVKEAGARGKVVVACRGVGDFSEYLVHGENALLVDVDDSPAVIADQLARLMTDPSSRGSLGARLRERVEERFGATPTAFARYLRLLDAPG